MMNLIGKGIPRPTQIACGTATMNSEPEFMHFYSGRRPSRVIRLNSGGCYIRDDEISWNMVQDFAEEIELWGPPKCAILFWGEVPQP